MFVWLWKRNKCARVRWFEKLFFFFGGGGSRFHHNHQTLSLNAKRLRFNLFWGNGRPQNDFLSNSKHSAKNRSMCEALLSYRWHTGRQSSRSHTFQLFETWFSMIFLLKDRRDTHHIYCRYCIKTHWNARTLLERLSGKYTVHRSSFKIW